MEPLCEPDCVCVLYKIYIGTQGDDLATIKKKKKKKKLHWDRESWGGFHERF